jgi:hypothetical protein
MNTNMSIKEFFESPAMAVPKERQSGDFEDFLINVFRDFRSAVDSLNPECHLSADILARQNEIQCLCCAIVAALRDYMSGQPEQAYRQLEKGINAVAHVHTLFTQEVDMPDIGTLYRASPIGPSEQLTRGRLFHIPFELRHLVGRHRYGIPGFPCLYLGGSLRLCQLELGVPDDKLAHLGIARFVAKRKVRLLDFGYRSATLAPFAAGRSLCARDKNLNAQNFFVSYVVSWPLIAAASVKRLYDGNWAAEYVIPQLLMQWLTREPTCDGIRFFSTKVPASATEVHRCANYVFPSRNPLGARQGYCAWLTSLFEMTESVMWEATTSGADALSEAAHNEARMVASPTAGVP